MSRRPAHRHNGGRAGPPAAAAQVAAFASPVPGSSTPSFMTETRFSELEGIHPATLRGVTEGLGLERLTEIQQKTYGAAASGQDVLGRARTGTGKTVAFLLPALNVVLSAGGNGGARAPQSGGGGRRPRGGGIGGGVSQGCVLVISPTRELATQIGTQAEALLKYHNGPTCQVMFGGTSIKRDVAQLSRLKGSSLPAVLVATPGRLLDHLENTSLSDGSKFSALVSRGVRCLVLDEMDRLLDMGFRREIAKILTYIPPPSPQRQTLLFSATLPADLKRIIDDTMRPDYLTVDCINDGDDAAETNALTEQSYVVLPQGAGLVQSIIQTVSLAMEDPDHKIIVFFPAARIVGFYAALFKIGLGIDVLEMHSRKPQGFRNKVSDQFRAASTGVMFSSDVSARGVDYPGITHVIQFGLPDSRESYIHRLGRTGRAGKKGLGWLVLAPYERPFLKALKDVDISEDKGLVTSITAGPSEAHQELYQKAYHRIRSGDRDLVVAARQAYQGFLGYYNSAGKNLAKMSKGQLVELANDFAKQTGLAEQPGLTKRTVGKMGLKGVPGILIVAEEDVKFGVGGGGGGGGV
eukprot:CAMPEP_0194294958 /NCGR_PEP_ID=MMETSP0169-20130528/52197_1 /TAXON_ID=218684 /ORGANISM="Corethron pennatum, Strain L29A3" /LENGTH=578 /DNA_ID=CAMNT_0039043995 /DNA_START=154 /DNA_END=1886 /DNA_ORIENTATION=-